MMAALQVGMAVGFIASLLGIMAALRQVAKRRSWPAEVQRKIIHVAAGSLAMVLPWLFADDWPVWVLLGLTLLAMLALRSPLMAGIGSTLHGVERRSYGDFLLVSAVGLVFLFHDGQAILYVLPLAVLTLADAAAALAGSTYGRVFFATEDGRKSVEGSAMFFMVTLIVSMICLLLMTETPRENVIVIAIAVAAFATLVEADSWEGFDNLFLPMGVLIFLAATLGVSLWDVALRMAYISVALVAVFAAARAFGTSAQVARVYAMAVFLVLSVALPVNAILPGLMMAAHAILARDDGPTRNFDALRMVAVLAVVSFGYLAAGSVVMLNALSFYGLTIACIGSCYGAQVFARRPVVHRLAAAMLIAAGFGAVWYWVVMMNPELVRWHGEIYGIAALVLACLAIVVALAPALASNRRTVRLSLLGGTPAAVFFVIEVLGAARS